jgi:hypothetical protein
VKQGGKVEIPCWRHALINYPHPLLKKGLVILDTPGLNALGTEPELTLSHDPERARSVVPAGDGYRRGPSRTWTCGKNTCRAMSRAVSRCCNKIDLMWDDLKTEEQIEIGIERQTGRDRREFSACARITSSRCPRKKGLIARIRGDAPLLARSRIEVLERLLAEEIIPSKQQILRAAVSRDRQHAGNSLQSATTQLCQQRIGELQEMGKLPEKNRELAKLLLRKLEQDKDTTCGTWKASNAPLPSC